MNFQYKGPEFFSESPEDFALNLRKRVNEAKDHSYITEIEYVTEEIEFIDLCEQELSSVTPNDPDYSLLGHHNLKSIDKAIDAIGFEKMFYGLRRKREILESFIVPPSVEASDASNKHIGLKDLFKSDAHARYAIKALRIVDPPLIDEDLTFIGKHKSAICVWFDTLARLGFLKGYFNREQKTSAIIDHLFEFSISSSMFDKVHERAEQLYRKQFEQFLSQFSD
jgi:hypothetical protein